MLTEKVVLGTAQLGMDYGISNLTGKPSRNGALNILSTAWEHGIEWFDTAHTYGSEELLGEFIRTHAVIDRVHLCSKIPSTRGTSDWQIHIRRSVEESLKKLSVPAIDVLFLHDPVDTRLLATHTDFFMGILSEYPVMRLGASVYSPEEVEALSVCPFSLAFQFPYNVLDRRFSRVRMPIGNRFARSILLQGLLSSKERLKEGAPEELYELRSMYYRVLAEHGFDPLSFAVSFVANSSCVDRFLIGVESPGQLLEVLSVETRYPEIGDELSSTIEPNSRWLDPRLWTSTLG